uniref:Uncharacterized protein n=1 Tax=Anguilla anguilla TaxID=7936 RepID=A0A0E9Q1R0_ANGAN
MNPSSSKMMLCPVMHHPHSQSQSKPSR